MSQISCGKWWLYFLVRNLNTCIGKNQTLQADNTAAGGYTLDYGPFGFCEKFDPYFQPWTGGGRHFSFFNQPTAAEANFHMFWTALRPLIETDKEALEKFDLIRKEFPAVMTVRIQNMWAAKLGLSEFDHPFVKELMQLMREGEVDFTIFFRELSHLPESVSAIKKSFYKKDAGALEERWQTWFKTWREKIEQEGNADAISAKMKKTNPKYTWREWLVVPAYQKATEGDYSLVRELQKVFADPYGEQSPEVEEKYYQLKPRELFGAGGISHYSCSS